MRRLKSFIGLLIVLIIVVPVPAKFGYSQDGKNLVVVDFVATA